MNLNKIKRLELPMALSLALTIFYSASAFSREAFQLMSIGNDGSAPESFYNGEHSAVTPDGRFVVFRSSEAHLTTPATNGGYQIFVRDRILGTTELISRNDQGDYGGGSSDWPAISNDGCRIVFESDSTNLVVGASTYGNRTYLRDRCAATPATSLIAIADNGQVANGASSRPDISADGRFVVFSAYANNLVSGIQENDQVYLRDLTNQTTTLLTRSIQDASKGGNFGSACPAISDDGSRVVFWSYADNLVAGDNNTVWDMFVYDTNANPHVRLVSSDANGVQQTKDGEGASTVTCPAISGDGKFVAFASHSNSLVAGDTQVSDIFIKELASGHIEKASMSTNGTPGNYDSSDRPSLSLDGTWVAFLSLATNLAPETGDSTGSRIVAHNRVTGETVGFTSAQTTDTPAISGDLVGRYLTAFFGDKLDSRYAIAGLFLYDRNKQPIADAGDDQNITNLVQVTLDGSQSYDPDKFLTNALDDPLTGFTWTQLEGPSVVLSNPHNKLPTYTPSGYGTYRFRLVVNDGLENSEPDEVTIQVVQPPPSGWKNVSPTGVCAKKACVKKYKKARTQLQSKANAAIKAMNDYKKALAAVSKARTPNKKAAAAATAAKKSATANKAQTAYENAILVVQGLHD